MKSPDEQPVAHPKTAAADHDILDIIRHRWSPRAFDPGRPVASDDLRRLFEAARWAPSSGNEQPWRFIVADRTRTPEAFAALLAALDDKNRLWAAAAPVLVLVAVRDAAEARETRGVHAWYDTGQAVAFLTLQATSIGLALRQMQGFDARVAREAAAVPAPFDPVVVIALGYAGDPEQLSSDRHRASERQPRSRRPVADFVFSGTWGQPA